MLFVYLFFIYDRQKQKKSYAVNIKVKEFFGAKALLFVYVEGASEENWIPQSPICLIAPSNGTA